MVEGRIKVFIVTENRLLREALFRLFENEKDVKVVGQAGSCADVPSQMLDVRPDVFLVNPASSSLSGLRELQRRHRSTPLKTVLFGMEEDKKLFFEAVRAGVGGYVLKDAYAPDLIAAVRAVARGEAACSPRLCMWLFSCFAKQSTWMSDLRLHVELGLTRRERELLPMIAQGLTNKEIASQLRVSEQTIKNHVHRMIRKSGASRRLEVVERCGLADSAV